MELNPNSHKGSEWIHIKILEFKINNTNNYSKSILKLDFGNSKIPSNENNYDLDELKEHIWHQLKERSNFVKPINKIVGNIYFDLGNILAQTRDVQSALDSYESAKEYGFESELMNQRIIKFEQLAKKAVIQGKIIDFIKDNIKILFWIGIFCGILFILLIIRWSKKRKGNST